MANEMHLDDIVNILKQKYNIPLKNDMVLFETGALLLSDSIS